MTLALLVATVVAGPMPVYAMDESEAIEAARESLDGATDYPWYDEENDSIRRVEVQPPPAPPKAREWEYDPALPNAPSWNLGGLFWGALELVAWLAVIAVFVFLVVLLVRAFLQRESARAVSDDSDETIDDRNDVDRVENLPFPVRRPKSDLLAEARRQYEAGNYSEAIIYLFSYQLVELDKSQFIRLTRGKTNRQYLREIRRDLSLQGLIEKTMVAFEDVFFGDHPLDRRRFEVCWHQLDEFHSHVQEAPA